MQMSVFATTAQGGFVPSMIPLIAAITRFVVASVMSVYTTHASHARNPDVKYTDDLWCMHEHTTPKLPGNTYHADASHTAFLSSMRTIPMAIMHPNTTSCFVPVSATSFTLALTTPSTRSTSPLMAFLPDETPCDNWSILIKEPRRCCRYCENQECALLLDHPGL